MFCYGITVDIDLAQETVQRSANARTGKLKLVTTIAANPPGGTGAVSPWGALLVCEFRHIFNLFWATKN